MSKSCSGKVGECDIGRVFQAEGKSWQQAERWKSARNRIISSLMTAKRARSRTLSDSQDLFHEEFHCIMWTMEPSESMLKFGSVLWNSLWLLCGRAWEWKWGNNGKRWIYFKYILKILVRFGDWFHIKIEKRKGILKDSSSIYIKIVWLERWLYQTGHMSKNWTRNREDWRTRVGEWRDPVFSLDKLSLRCL